MGIALLRAPVADFGAERTKVRRESTIARECFGAKLRQPRAFEAAARTFVVRLDAEHVV